jgi:Ethanolamine utilization protein EutJ (predicted chaperonin)
MLRTMQQLMENGGKTVGVFNNGILVIWDRDVNYHAYVPTGGGYMHFAHFTNYTAKTVTAAEIETMAWYDYRMGNQS